MFKPRMWLGVSFLSGSIVMMLVAITAFNTGCSHFGDSKETRNPAALNSADKYGDRGSEAEYDPGAPKGSDWAKLFGNVPNYRSVGVQVLKGKAMVDEKFRWQMGPMWYRGRLSPQDVKVLIVGQEGAQDENVSNRAFTGSTGTRVQKFLKHLGIHRSYLFLNTFVYTINGQLEDDPAFTWLEQGVNSPIVLYRHSLFDYMLQTNNESVALFMGVGRGGKASLASWINARGGNCSTYSEIKDCDTSGMIKWFGDNRKIFIKNKILVVGVPHPGGANPNLGGDAALQNIVNGFSNAAARVATFKRDNKGWLEQDPDEKLKPNDLLTQMEKPFKYGHGSIPFRDFAFNTNWRMGAEGTTSNRWGADSIQVFSDDGEYNDKSSFFKKPQDLDSGLNSTRTGPAGMLENELAYEAPRTNSYDYGPCGLQVLDNNSEKMCDLAQLLVGWPNMEDIGVNAVSHPSLGYNGTYRGRTEKAEVFILADQTSHDDLFSGRALTGTEGQKLNKVLSLAGIPENYFILRTYPIDVLGSSSNLIAGAKHPLMLAHYKKIIDIVKANKIIAMGPIANAIASELKLKNVISIPNELNADSGNAVIKALSGQVGSYNGELTNIPRIDMPYHTRIWMGTSGDRAARAPKNGNYYRYWAPEWVEDLQPKPLSSTESKTISDNQKNYGTSFYKPGNADLK